MNLNFFILFFIPLLFSSQNSSFIYELNFKPNSDSIKTEKIIYFLDIQNKESLFRSDKFRYSDSIRIKRGIGEGFDIGFNNKQLYIHKNYTNNETKKYVFVPLIFSIYEIKIDEILYWNITDEKSKIGNYDCQKAETNYGGRKWIAWFTNQIPIQDGPYIFRGLPGLIVAITDEKLDYSFQLGEVRDFLWKELYPEKAQKQISWNEYSKLLRNFYSDPFAMINKSDITSYDDSGNIIKTDFKEMTESMQKRIRENNNPLELNHKVEYK